MSTKKSIKKHFFVYKTMFRRLFQPNVHYNTLLGVLTRSFTPKSIKKSQKILFCV